MILLQRHGGNPRLCLYSLRANFLKHPVTVYVLYGAVRPGGMLRIAGAKRGEGNA